MECCTDIANRNMGDSELRCYTRKPSLRRGSLHRSSRYTHTHTNTISGHASRPDTETSRDFVLKSSRRDEEPRFCSKFGSEIWLTVVQTEVGRNGTAQLNFMNGGTIITAFLAFNIDASDSRTRGILS